MCPEPAVVGNPGCAHPSQTASTTESLTSRRSTTLPFPDLTEDSEKWKRLNAESLWKIQTEEAVKRDNERRQIAAVVKKNSWPPSAARPILRRIKKRYWRLSITERPSQSQDLLTLEEVLALVKIAGGIEVLKDNRFQRWLNTPPKQQQRRRHKEIIRNLIAIEHESPGLLRNIVEGG